MTPSNSFIILLLYISIIIYSLLVFLFLYCLSVIVVYVLYSYSSIILILVLFFLVLYVPFSSHYSRAHIFLSMFILPHVICTTIAPLSMRVYYSPAYYIANQPANAHIKIPKKCRLTWGFVLTRNYLYISSRSAYKANIRSHFLCLCRLTWGFTIPPHLIL